MSQPPPSGPGLFEEAAVPVPEGPESLISATPRTVWRRARGPVAFVLALSLCALLIAVLMPRGSAGRLDPGNPGRSGGRALAEILRDRGTEVVTVRTLDDIRFSATADDIVLITSPHYVRPADWPDLTPGSTNLVIVEPNPAALTVLAPGVRRAGDTLVRPRPPGCALPAARLAGEADLGGQLFYVAGEAAELCYDDDDGLAPLVHRALPGGRTVTVLGTATPLTNAALGERGNAALALNLLEGHDRVLWFAPRPPAAGSAGEAGLVEMLPPVVGLVTLQLLVAVLLLALWRARRLGPLVPERLPVVVRAAETTRGLGRLYRARQARDRAAAALRDAWRGRVCAGLGLPPDSDPRAVVDEVAQRTGRSAEEVGGVLYGPDPRDDAALVRLADALDTLEREVRRP